MSYLRNIFRYLENFYKYGKKQNCVAKEQIAGRRIEILQRSFTVSQSFLNECFANLRSSQARIEHNRKFRHPIVIRFEQLSKIFCLIEQSLVHFNEWSLGKNNYDILTSHHLHENSNINYDTADHLQLTTEFGNVIRLPTWLFLSRYKCEERERKRGRTLASFDTRVERRNHRRFRNAGALFCRDLVIYIVNANQFDIEDWRTTMT